MCNKWPNGGMCGLCLQQILQDEQEAVLHIVFFGYFMIKIVCYQITQQLHK